MGKCVVTIAVGKTYYLKLAENLLRSFIRWNNNNDIQFLLITDNISFYNKYADNKRISFSKIDLSDEEKSFTSKLKLFDFVSADENLFIDCDCLVYKDISFVFDAFKGKHFSTIGTAITKGEFFCDVPTTIKYFGIAKMPKLVGSIYFFKKDEVAKHVFEKALELKSSYDELGFVRLRNKENEEPLLAVAMELNNESIVENDGTIKADLMYYQKIKSNVLTGSTLVFDRNLNIDTGGENIEERSSPAILHFNGEFSESYQYLAEEYRINYNSNNVTLVNLLAFFKIELGAILIKNFKNLFRPIYLAILGHRKVGKSKRIA